MRRLAYVVAALARATKEYEESFAEDLFGNLELYEQASLNATSSNSDVGSKEDQKEALVKDGKRPLKAA